PPLFLSELSRSHFVFKSKSGARERERHIFLCTISWWISEASTLFIKSTRTESAMIGFRERERSTREKRVSLTRASILLLWVMLVFALILILFFSINNETNHNNNKNHSIRLLRQQPQQQKQQRSFNKALLFHATPTKRTRTRTRTRTTRIDDQAGVPEKAFYDEEKRVIHTGPNPLHN
ncbi:hypothetical protein RYX36_036399, partial [Vicia faba]